MSPTLGAEVQGLDLRRPLDAETLRELWLALLEWKLLVFRDQPLEPLHHVQVALRFGSLFDDSTDVPQAGPARQLPAVRARTGCGRARQRVARRRLVPAAAARGAQPARDRGARRGGDTLFTDMAVAYDNLPDDARVRRRARRRERLVDRLHAGAGTYGDRYEAIKASLPATAHPVARPHPITGRTTLYANMAFTERLVGGDDELFAFFCAAGRGAGVPGAAAVAARHVHPLRQPGAAALRHQQLPAAPPGDRAPATIESWSDEVLAFDLPRRPTVRRVPDDADSILQRALRLRDRIARALDSLAEEKAAAATAVDDLRARGGGPAARRDAGGAPA